MPAGLYVTGGGGGGGGGLPGARPRDYNSASGGVPGVTSPVDTITGNLGNFGNIINSLTGASTKALRDQYPEDYFSILGTLLGNTQRRAAGDISDLLPELQQSSAEAAVAGGVSGSGAQNTKLLRDMGLTRYGVENQALKDLSTLQGEIPTVRPFDPNDIIRQQLDAQERADLYAAAPSPEAAYQRAAAAAGGGGGSGSGTPGFRYNIPGGGGGGKTADFAFRGLPQMAPQFGTAMNPFGGSMGMSPAPYGSFGGGEDDFSDVLSVWNDNDFGGSTGYGGGNNFSTSLQNYEDFDPWLASLLDTGGGLNFGSDQGFGGRLDYGGGNSFYGGGEDFGLTDYGGGGGDYFDYWDA